jgi:CspA family cold shock protein
MSLITGQCKWFNETKGFGFIVRDDGQGDVFVHKKDVENSGLLAITEGDRVEFEIRENRGRTSAGNLRKIS